MFEGHPKGVCIEGKEFDLEVWGVVLFKGKRLLPEERLEFTVKEQISVLCRKILFFKNISQGINFIAENLLLELPAVKQ